MTMLVGWIAFLASIVAGVLNSWPIAWLDAALWVLWLGMALAALVKENAR